MQGSVCEPTKSHEISRNLGGHFYDVIWSTKIYIYETVDSQRNLEDILDSIVPAAGLVPLVIQVLGYLHARWWPGEGIYGTGTLTHSGRYG